VLSSEATSIGAAAIAAAANESLDVAFGGLSLIGSPAAPANVGSRRAARAAPGVAQSAARRGAASAELTEDDDDNDAAAIEGRGGGAPAGASATMAALAGHVLYCDVPRDCNVM